MNEEQARGLLEHAEEALEVLKSWGVSNLDMACANCGLVNFEADGNEELERLLRAANIVALMAYSPDLFDRVVLTVAKTKVFPRED